MPAPNPPGPSTLLPGPLAMPIFESAAMSPSFFTLARSFVFLSGSTLGVPRREGAASFFVASGLPSFPSSSLLFSPSLAPEASFTLGGSGGLGGAFTW